MDILKQLYAILEDRGNGPTVSIMLTRNQATDLYNTLNKIIFCNIPYHMDLVEAIDCLVVHPDLSSEHIAELVEALEENAYNKGFAKGYSSVIKMEGKI